MPLARILVFALALTHAVGLADLVLDDACGDVCTDKECGNDCLPGVACRCHGPSTLSLLSGVVESTHKLDIEIRIAPLAGTERTHANPDPLEILHVPRFSV